MQQFYWLHYHCMVEDFMVILMPQNTFSYLQSNSMNNFWTTLSCQPARF